ncbi:hypothetical protein ACE1OC_36700 [Streptomyces sp. DSM 116496]|uniref:hypothetical protein n=1 Tax=Streptomyces stoeckheimensis TaxID=3344656 RepID=UPI0038B38984
MDAIAAAPVALALALAGVLCGCGAPASRVEGATQAALTFERALTGGDYLRACAQLAPQTRQQLEEEEHEQCVSALRDQKPPTAGEAREAEVYGRQALLRIQGDTLFLSQFGDGWKVVAAGCVPQGEKPYRCSLKSG